MCGRYSFAPKPKQIKKLLSGLEAPTQLDISYNIAPTHQAYVITMHNDKIILKMEWGLVPNWSKDGKNSGKLINARAEGIDEKPSFREPFNSRRCLIPADSFYEWKKEPGSKKAPYRILLKNGELIFMAGIWDEWKSSTQEKRSFTIITCVPNLEMGNLHNRMPVILSDLDSQEKWLSGAAGQELLRPLPDGLLSIYRISDKLNKPGLDSESLHEPIPEPWRLF